MIKRSSTSQRLKQLMEIKNLRQVDILEAVKPYSEHYGIKFSKNALSQYVSGKVEPKQDKLFILGMALNIDEAWLMGFDVPMERKRPVTDDGNGLTDKKQILLNLVAQLPDNQTDAMIHLLQTVVDSHVREK